ncbi:hypothetical protein WJX81_000094 [Elliptochloris bilobata]|uniref:AP5B1 middle domain-containing protein n=1 Tax=Elliptochloris bilobata TaxID=381761 RepID=A0AAW1QU11_9CHLO
MMSHPAATVGDGVVNVTTGTKMLKRPDSAFRSASRIAGTVATAGAAGAGAADEGSGTGCGAAAGTACGSAAGAGQAPSLDGSMVLQLLEQERAACEDAQGFLLGAFERLAEVVEDAAAAAALERVAWCLVADKGRPDAGATIFAAADRCFASCSDPSSGARPLHSALLQPREQPGEPAGAPRGSKAQQALALAPAALPRFFGFMEAAASFPGAQCQGTLAAVYLYLRHVIASGAPPPWSEGLALLRVCRALALRADAPAEALGTVLELAAARHPDLDIRDSAALYASLLSALPPERLARVLAGAGASPTLRPASAAAEDPAGNQGGLGEGTAAPRSGGGRDGSAAASVEGSAGRAVDKATVHGGVGAHRCDSPTLVPLRLAPEAALPDMLLPTARFTDAAGRHGAAKLAPLALRLAHLLTPAPLPRSLAGRSDEVFDVLWTTLSQHDAASAAAPSARGSPDGLGSRGGLWGGPCARHDMVDRDHLHHFCTLQSR